MDFFFPQLSYRWRPKTFVRDELYAIIRNAVEDSYKRLILPLLTRSYRYFWALLLIVASPPLPPTLCVKCSYNSISWAIIPLSQSLRVVCRTKLTSAAEKESIAMFVRNLRQRLLVCPVRGCVIMGVDPGFKHGCKLAILSPTSEWQHWALWLDCQSNRNKMN